MPQILSRQQRVACPCYEQCFLPESDRFGGMGRTWGFSPLDSLWFQVHLLRPAQHFPTDGFTDDRFVWFTVSPWPQQVCLSQTNGAANMVTGTFVGIRHT